MYEVQHSPMIQLRLKFRRHFGQLRHLSGLPLGIPVMVEGIQNFDLDSL
jgi:hypothetical protein